ncbi:MAG: phage adaptor protein, partial [bacterium]
SSSVILTVELRQTGAVYTGKSITVNILQTDGTALVSGGACTEVGSSGAYYYTYTTPSTAQTLMVQFYEGSTPMGEGIELRVVNTLASAGGGDTDVYTTVNNMVSRLKLTFTNFSLPYNTSDNSKLIQFINEGVGYICRRLKVLEDDFVYNVTTTPLYQLDSVLPYPYDIKHVWYNTGASEVELTWADRSVTRADVAASNATITRYTTYGDANNHYLQLNGTPAANIASGLRVFGYYRPLYVSAGETLPIEKHFDPAIEALAMQMMADEYDSDISMKEFCRLNVEAEMNRLGLVEMDRARELAQNS